MKSYWHRYVLLPVVGLLAIPLVAQAKSADRGGDQEERDNPKSVERKGADDRLDQIMGELKRMQEDIRNVNQRVSEMQMRMAKSQASEKSQATDRNPEMGRSGMAPDRAMEPMMERMRARQMQEQPAVKQPAVAERPERGRMGEGRGGRGMGMMRHGRGMGMMQPGRGIAGQACPNCGQCPMVDRARQGEPAGRLEAFRSRAGGSAEAPLIGRILMQMRERIEALRHDGKIQNPRMAAERLRDILRDEVKKLDQFLDNSRPEPREMPKKDEMKKDGPRPERGGPGFGGPGMRRGGPGFGDDGPGMRRGGPGMERGGPGFGGRGPRPDRDEDR